MLNHCKKCQCSCATCKAQGDNKCNGNPCECHPNLEDKILADFEQFYCVHMDFMMRDGSIVRPTKEAFEKMRKYLSTVLKEQREEMLRMLPPENKLEANMYGSGWNDYRKALLDNLK